MFLLKHIVLSFYLIYFKGQLIQITKAELTGFKYHHHIISLHSSQELFLSILVSHCLLLKFTLTMVEKRLQKRVAN